MFLHYLNEREKKAFLTLAKEFILVDGELSSEEEELMDIMKGEMGLQEGFNDGNYSRDELFDMFESKRSRVAALIEMQGLGYANMEYHTQEKVFIHEMAESFNISDEELADIDDWVVRQVALLYEANEFWE